MNSEAKKIRHSLLNMYYKANAGHIGCSMSCVEILVASLLNSVAENDSFILSKGHAAAALYATLNLMGDIDNELLDTFYKNGTILPAHPAPNKFSKIPFATGSLGHGFSIAAGIAKANKINNNSDYSFVLMSDGETNEGTTWEAANFAVAHKLDNLICIIDKNGLQGFGNTKDVMGETANFDIFNKIGFETFTIDGHNTEEMIGLIEDLKNAKNSKPKMIIANTTKGKGVSFMENKLEWHYLPMNPEQFKIAIAELEN